jgi:DNA polymerase-1
MASSQQVAKFLYEDLKFEEIKDRKGRVLRNKPSKKYPLGAPKTDEETIEQLKPTNDRQRRFIKLKSEESKLRKAITSYTSNFVEACEKDACMIHGSLNQAVTQTQRLSSSNPNLQNIDRKLKKCITPRKKGWLIKNADFAAIEMRVAGMLAQDVQCKTDIETGHDFHSYTASVRHSKAWEKAGSSRHTKQGDEVRTLAKPDTFRPLYGAQGADKEEKAYVEAFRKRYPQIYEMQRGWVDEVLRTKQLACVTGLKFYWPDTTMQSSGYVTNTTSIFNYPIQNLATGEIAPTGVCLLWHYLNGLEMKSFLINEVHDNALAEECPEESELLEQLVVKAMQEDIVWFFEKLCSYSINFPIAVDQASTTHWGYNEVEEELEAA